MLLVLSCPRSISATVPPPSRCRRRLLVLLLLPLLGISNSRQGNYRMGTSSLPPVHHSIVELILLLLLFPWWPLSQCQMFVKLLTSDTELCPERMSVHPGTSPGNVSSSSSSGMQRRRSARIVTLKWMGRLLWNEPLATDRLDSLTDSLPCSIDSRE